MSEPVPREWRFFIDDMIASAEKVVTYTHALDQAGFVASGMNYDATLRNLELIGERPLISLKMCDRPIRRFPGGSSLPLATG